VSFIGWNQHRLIDEIAAGDGVGTLGAELARRGQSMALSLKSPDFLLGGHPRFRSGTPALARALRTVVGDTMTGS
jgi:hypothetical protein